MSRIQTRQNPTQAANIAEVSRRGLCFHEMRHTGSDGLVAPCGNTARIDTMLQQTRRKRCRYDLVSEIAYLFILVERRYGVLGAIWRRMEGCLVLLIENSSFMFKNWRESVALWWFPGLTMFVWLGATCL